VSFRVALFIKYRVAAMKYPDFFYRVSTMKRPEFGDVSEIGFF
jgi:hypothetical protein